MKWIVQFKVKEYCRVWSNQKICTNYKGVVAEIKIEDTNCTMILEGDKNIQDVFRIIWELLFLYDGYFYEPISYEIDGNKRDCKELITLPFYKTDKKWYISELLGRNERDLSPKVLNKYDNFRNKGISERKMNKALVNAFYNLSSENYGKINVNHRLSLLLNIADGFVINTYRETNSVKASLDRIFKKTINIDKLQQGISLMGIDEKLYKGLLSEERTAFDHYIYKENSLNVLIYETEDRTINFANWYFIYILELVIRINFLKESGVTLDQEAMDYALDAINDWIIYENNIDKECATSHYKFLQKMKEKGIEIK